MPIQKKMQEIFKNRKSIYRSVDLKIAAVKVRDKWYNLRAVAFFSDEDVEKKLQKTVEVENFALFSAQSSQLLSEIFDIVEQPELHFGSETIRFTDKGDKPQPRVEYRDYWSRSGELSKEHFGLVWPADYFRYEWDCQIGYGRVLNSVDSQLKCHDPPFEDVKDVVHSLLDIERQDMVTGASRLWLVFPTYVAFDQCLLDGNKLELSVKFKKPIDLKKVRISLIGKGPKIVRSQVRLGQTSDSTQDSAYIVKKSVSLKEISDVKAYLFLETDRPIAAVDIRSIRNQRSQINKRLAAHEVFDVGSTKIFECLIESLKHSRRFEWAIATILHFCGFQTELMGIEGMGQVPDILAYYQEEDALIIGECTVGVPDENKILKLIERAKRLSSVSERVQAVIFLNVNREMLKEIAIPSDIKIIDKEEIREIFNKASRGSSVREIYYQHFSPQYMGI